MRQHVNPLSNYFHSFEPIPPLEKIFKFPYLPLHIDIGCGAGNFLFELAEDNYEWNYIGIEIREKLVLNAKNKLENYPLDNLYFSFGNANHLINECIERLPKNILQSVSFNFPDPWYKKKHHKRRIVQSNLIYKLSQFMSKGTLIFIKSDVKELFQFMDFIILRSSFYERIDNYKNKKLFNPKKLRTERENYAISKNLSVFEKTYQRV
tara:strand:- start:96 stop:719 length:624 start_codon:yes stop_codon:yes gene_type:complete